MSPLVTLHTQKKSDFFNERILINGRLRLSKHAPRHLPPIFFSNRARFRRERADLVPFIWVLLRGTFPAPAEPAAAPAALADRPIGYISIGRTEIAKREIYIFMYMSSIETAAPKL